MSRRSGFARYSFIERDPENNGVLQACEDLGSVSFPWGSRVGDEEQIECVNRQRDNRMHAITDKLIK